MNTDVPARPTGRRLRVGTRAAGDRSGTIGRLLSSGVLLLLAAALPAQQRPVPVSIDAISTVAAVPGERLAASVARLLGEWYGALLDARPADAATSGQWRLRFAFTRTDRGLELTSELWDGDRPTPAAAHTSWLPPGSLGSVVATAAGDGFRLWSQAHRFPFPGDLAPAPSHGAVLPAAGLARLLQRPVAAHEVRTVAAYPEGILVHLLDGPIALGRQFAPTPDTVVWLTWRDRFAASGADWHTLYPLHDGRVVLVPHEGDPVVVDPLSERSAPVAQAPSPTASAGAAPAALVAVTGSGTSVWYRPGRLDVRPALGPPASAASLRLPRGSLVPTATTASPDGTIWVFDPRERRIRALALSGGELRQVFSVTPLLPARELGGVQALAVTAGGHFLIGTRRAIWKLDRRGMPHWSLTLLRHQPRQRLPQAFSLTAGTEEGAFLLLDRTSGSVHRFSEQPEPPASSLLTSTDSPAPAAVAAALTVSALQATDQAWQRHRPAAALRLLAAARRFLNRWRAADPLAEGVEERSGAIDRFTEAVDRALYSEPELTLQVVPDRYHRALGTYYEQHPFAVTVRNVGGDREPSAVELGLAGAATATLLALPAMAAGEEVTLPVQLAPGPRLGSTDLPVETSLWLYSARKSELPASLTAVPFTVVSGRCLPAEARAAPAGLAHVAFLDWHLASADATPAIGAPPDLSPYRLVDGVARLADVVPAQRCATQSPARTLTALSGSATDWSLAVGSLLAQRGVPVALLLADAVPVMLLAALEHLGHVVDPSVPHLAPAATRQLSAHLDVRAQGASVASRLASGPVWVLLPKPAAVAGAGSAQAWSSAGVELADKLLASHDAGWSLVFFAGSDEERPPSDSRPDSPVPIVLPLGT